jgi:hypothetical protein
LNVTKRHSCSIVLCSYGKEYEQGSEWGEKMTFLKKDLKYEPYLYVVCLNYSFSHDLGLLEGVFASLVSPRDTGLEY